MRVGHVLAGEKALLHHHTLHRQTHSSGTY